MIKMVLLGLLVGLCGAGQPVFGGGNPEVPEFGFIDMPPYGYPGGEGEALGHLADISNTVLEAMGQPVKWRHLPAPRVYQQVRTGHTELTLGPRDLSFIRDHALQSREPAVVMKLSAYRLPDTPPITSLHDFAGKHVALLQGYSYGDLVPFFEDNAHDIRVEYARTHLSGLQMTLYGRVDYLVDYTLPAGYVIDREKIPALVSDPLLEVPIHLFVSKSWPHAEDFMQAWDAHFAALKAAGELPVEIDPRHLNR
ncbi:substrate-binding periplasmic protein [Marinobacter sp.]|uniref:substrate-binding periplasmic protein n=1 Tax=Marinobacter sp. TaxID=50741 RepID=UPI00384D9275